MPFLEAKLETFLSLLNQLNSDDLPHWGIMSAQRMVEHLSDTIDLSIGKINFQLEIPEDKIEKAQSFLASEHPMPKEFEAVFATKDIILRNKDLQAAIDELSFKWKEFENFYKTNPAKRNIHPYFGNLDKDQWFRIHQKHFTHHFQQFGLIA